MPVELRPLGVRCNIQCRYCYQNPQRHVGYDHPAYDIEVMKAALLKEGQSFNLFGGEPLLVPEHDLEALWSWGFNQYGTNGIQTNGTLINENHVRMFKRYKVAVGISVDGPAELNDVRWGGSLERTRQATARTHAAIERLCREGVIPGLIVTLHRGNATRDKLPMMHLWFRHLESLGVVSVRLHVLEVENLSVREGYALSTEENLEALLSFARFEVEGVTKLKFDVFQEMRSLLMGRDEELTCIWKACDPYSTRAVRGVEGNGESSNCGRVNKDGISFNKSDIEGFERNLALHYTSEQDGGCLDCRFFLLCKGHCPGTAERGDWRNRSEHCGLWKGLFEHFETELIQQGLKPVTVGPIRRTLEDTLVTSWSSGENPSVASILKSLREPRARATGAQTTPVSACRPRGPKLLTSPLMERLDFVLPDFNRLAWVSERARALWEPRVEDIARRFHQIEYRSVAEGLRPCCAVTMSPTQFLEEAEEWTRLGLTALPLEVLDASNYNYSNVAAQPEPGKPQAFRFALGRPHDVLEFKEAWNRADQQKIGEMLGYPRCCYDFFQRVWVEEEFTDTTWPVAAATAPRQNGQRLIEVTGPPEANILWRWMGVRAVPHLPCSFACPATVVLGRSLIELGRAAGYREEMDWLLEVLSWPVEWSAMHGIAEIMTPVLKVSTRTDATALEYVVRWQGTSYPAEGAQGQSYPFRRQQRSEPARASWYAPDNGFTSIPAMLSAHRPVVTAVQTAIGMSGGSVLDLGCGNGALLLGISEACPNTIPFGIDCLAERIEHARLVLPRFSGNLQIANLFDLDAPWAQRDYDASLLMIGRLLEAGPERAERLKAWLSKRSRQVVIYAYADWIARYGDLKSVALAANVCLPALEEGATCCLASF